jgi:hypothetical protein
MGGEKREIGFCFQGDWTKRQPWRGVFVLIVTLVASLILTASFNIQEYTGIVGYLIMSFIPMFVVIGLFWKRAGIIPESPQPFKGILLTTLVGIIAVLTAKGLIAFLGKGVLLPHIVLHTVCTIITTFFIALAFGFWPFNKLSPVAGGFLTVIVAYVIGWIILQFFNFAMLSYPTGVNPSPVAPVPFYAPGGPLAKFEFLAPMGPFLWEHSISFYFWAIVIVFSFLMINFWPFSALRIGQPLFGLLVTVGALVISYVVNLVCIDFLKVEPLRCFLCGICYVFGILLILIPFEMWPGRAIGRLLGGVINLLIAVGIGIVAYKTLLSFCKWHFGEGMTYPNDIFAMATLMLGMIFPMWSCYSDLFDFWPLPSEK